MIFLPIVSRELRVAGRRRATHFVRAGLALGAIIIGGLVYLDNLSSSQHEFATSLFGVLTALSILYGIGCGVRSTADCLSREKRDGTLGLLFLTDLNGYDVVLGKLTATSVDSLYGLFAIFPILALPLILGGLTHGEFWRIALVLVNTFLFSLATGVFVSAISRSARKAMALTFGLLLLFTAVLPGCGGLLLHLLSSHKSLLADVLFMPSPVYSVAMASDSEYTAARWHFWCSSAVIHGLTWLYLTLASWVVPRSWQDKPDEGSTLRWRQKWREWMYGNPEQKQIFRQQLLDLNPFYWLASRVVLKPALVWLPLAVFACFWVWGCMKTGSEWFNEGIFFPTALLLNSYLKLWVGSEAGRKLAEDRHEGTLELILSTPLSVKDILRGQMRALLRQFLWPLVMIVGIELIFLMASLQRESFQANPINPVVWFASLIMLVADLVALTWVAMWTALTAKTFNRSAGITIVRILYAPWVLYITIVIMVMAFRDINALPQPKWTFYVGLWFLLGILTDIGFGVVAWWQLRSKFRELALQQYAPGGSGFRRLLSRFRWK